MSKNNRSKVVYPEENGTKDANNKLKSQVRSLRKNLKRLEMENRTLSRAFDKSCDFIKYKLKDYSLEQITRMIENFEYKETEKGRERENKKEKKIFNSNKCSKCGKLEGDGYSIMSFKNFTINTCSCGYRLRVDVDEGIERS